MRKKLLSILALLCLTVSGAWAVPARPMDTIESNNVWNTYFTSGSRDFIGATVTFSGDVMNNGDQSGWFSMDERTLTVTAAEGFTITGVKFYNKSGSAFDYEAPFQAILGYEGDRYFTKVNDTSIGEGGVTKIEVYGYRTNADFITIDPDFLTLDAEMHQGDDFLPFTYKDIIVENAQSFILQFYTAEGEEIETQASQMPGRVVYSTTTSPWLIGAMVTRTGADAYQVNVATYENDGGARSVYFRLFAYDADSTLVCSNLATVTQLAYDPPADYDVTANLANGAYWATFYSNAGNYQAPSGTQVFAVNLNTSTAKITMTEIEDRIVKHGQGVVLKKETTSTDLTTTITMTFDTATAPAGDFSANSLTGTMTSITNPGNAYVLNGKNGAGFYKLSDGGTIGANKAYLTYSGAGAREFFLFDEATGIEMPTVEDVNADAVFYDLQGRRVAQPTKGLYIVNGKKVIK